MRARRTPRRVDEVAGLAVLHLQRDAADVAARSIGRAFQSASETVRPKPSRVDFWISTSACDWNAFTSIAPTLFRLLRILMSGSPAAYSSVVVEELPALGVVGGHRADERELHLGHLLVHDPVGVDHAERVLPRVEARDLADQRPVDVDAELVADERRVLGRERHVLRRQRVDRGRADVRRLPSFSPAGTYFWRWKTVPS